MLKDILEFREEALFIDELQALDQLMHEPENIKDQSVFTKYEQLKSELFQEMQSWEKHQMALEKFSKNRN